MKLLRVFPSSEAALAAFNRTPPEGVASKDAENLTWFWEDGSETHFGYHESGYRGASIHYMWYDDEFLCRLWEGEEPVLEGEKGE